MKGLWRSAAVLLVATAALAAGNLTPRERAARFYFDLGDDHIDVSKYPRAQQENYALFAQKCSQCHTLARPINAPFYTRRDWTRFLNRMRANIRSSSKSQITPAQEKLIVDFLVYDSKIRKIDDRKAFEDRLKHLQADYKALLARRPQIEKAEDQKKIKPYGDDTQPAPRP